MASELAHDPRNPSTNTSIAFVGAGPTTLYTLCALLAENAQPVSVTIFEEQSRAGLGTPYRPGWNDPAMLSNIASLEIPPIQETLIDWLRRQPRSRLVRLGIDPDMIDDRAFYPRVALGEYFLDQFNALIERARECEADLEIVPNCRVLDIVPNGTRLTLSLKSARGDIANRDFDHVVLATGHQWPRDPEARPGYFLSPWPATALQRVPPCEVGIRGSSLTAIDAVVALATAHGTFIESGGSNIDYRINPGAERLRITMMSRKGLLPEADFFHPVPYEPLSICTPEAMRQLLAEDAPDVLDRAFLLMKAEFSAADADYADRIGLAELRIENFADRYFAERMKADPFNWAVANLADARADFERHHTVPWRYAILRMHEVIALIVPFLDAESLDRFNHFLKPVFIDEYATVPHLSIERLLALHRAGRLEVIALGDNHWIDSHGVARGAAVMIEGARREFEAFVDATGQRPIGVESFPFPTLIDAGLIVEPDDDPDGVRGIAVDENFRPRSRHALAAQLHCLSIPFLLDRHPFVQGITSSHEMGQIVGADLARTLRSGGRERQNAETSE